MKDQEDQAVLLNERFVFGAAIIIGYFATGWLAGIFIQDPNHRDMLRDMQLTVGPILGMIAQSIWKSDRQSNQQADSVNKLAERVPLPPSSRTVTYETGPSNAETTPIPEPDAPVADGGTPLGAKNLWSRPKE